MESVHRTRDGELCGHVEELDGGWLARTVFGAVLGRHAMRTDAVAQVLDEGLAALAERWVLRGPDGSEEVVCIVEASAVEVTLARGYYTGLDVPTVRIPAADIRSGRWDLHR